MRNTRNDSSLPILAASLAILFLTTGCATRKFVREEVQGARQQTEELETRTETQIEELQTGLEKADERIDMQGEEIAAVSRTAEEALERAVAAGQLAEGKLLYETTFSDEDVSFPPDRSQLSDEARAALDGLASQLKAENRSVYLEIQGHTDSTGSEAHNLRLGERRAEAVKRYFNMEHGIPLHRMATISYGESAPVADNGSREGRARNRRVVVVVLR